MKRLTNSRKTFHILSFIIVIFVIGACGNNRNKSTISVANTETQNGEATDSIFDKKLLVGSWKDNSKSALHFTLFNDGTARSDNMQTLLYKKWRVEGNQITFTLESIGNKTTSIEDVTYTIEKLTSDTLVLKKGSNHFEYTKQ